jgi:hypothetical protein
MKVEIDYLFNGCLQTIAYKITYINSFGKTEGIYISPYIYKNIEDAYLNSILQLS